jgi:hypothetical protein
MSGVGQRVVTAAILANIPVAVWCEVSPSEVPETLDALLLCFFAYEIVCRAFSAARRGQFDSWLVIDALIVVVALLPFGVTPVMRAAKLAHIARHGMHLKHLTIARAVHV